MLSKSLMGAAIACLTTLSASAYADIISYGGYTHDTSTDIVTGNGLEWLQWDVTVGQSIDSALAAYAADGWTVASNVQMAQLFNAFDFGLTFDTYENTTQFYNTDFSSGDPGTEPDEIFITMFGDTYKAVGLSYCYGGDCYTQTEAWFGTDFDQDGYYNKALVFDDYIYSGGSNYSGKALMYDDFAGISQAGAYVGVALVREVSAVPVPAAVWLFGSGLLGLIGVARRNVQG